MQRRQHQFRRHYIENLTSQFGLSQTINEATHILESSSSHIDHIFTTQLHLVVESGIHPSLYPNCHHRIVFSKFYLQIHYLPPYPQELWHYKKVNTELIRREITDFNWDGAFLCTNMNVKISIFRNIIMNIPGDHWRETNEQWKALCFNRINFVVIPSYTELPRIY